MQVRRQKACLAAGNELAEDDIMWNGHTCWTFPTLCTGAGVVAGLFGIGGGLLFCTTFQLQCMPWSWLP